MDLRPASRCRLPCAGSVPLCGLPDSLRRRAYFCMDPDVCNARAVAAPKWIVVVARSEEHNPMWVTGFFPNPS